MLPVSFLPGARQDFEASCDWYAERDRAVTGRFIDAVSATVERIQADPSSLPYVTETHQVCSVKRFPFRVVFKVYSHEIVVVAVAHAKREPHYWESRE